MKKTRLFVSLLLFAALLSLAAAGAFQVFAEDEAPPPRLNDKAELLSEDESAALLERLDALSEKHDFGIFIATVPEVEVPDGWQVENAVRDCAVECYYIDFGQGEEDDGILLLACVEPDCFRIYTFGRGERFFTAAGIDYILDALNEEHTFSERCDSFASLCDDFITQAKAGSPYGAESISFGCSEETPEDGSSYGAESADESAAGEASLPDESAADVTSLPDESAADVTPPPRLNDEAGLLTAEEKGALLERLDALSEKHGFDIVIATIAKADIPDDEYFEAGIQDFADLFFENNGFGKGEEYDGILFLYCEDPRCTTISTSGFGECAFTLDGQRYINGKVQPLLKSADYHAAFDKFVSLCDDFIDEAKAGKPYDGGHMPKEPLRALNIVETLIAVAVGFLIAYLSANNKRSKLTSVVPQRDAQAYEKEGSPNITDSEDRFISRVVTTTHIQRSSGSSGGGSGSGSHTSSSGRSHGGSVSRF